MQNGRIKIGIAAALVGFLALLGLAPLAAEMTTKVIAAFRGKIVVSRGPLPEGRNDQDSIVQIKKAWLKELTGQEQDGARTWNFHYTAFLAGNPRPSMTLAFRQGRRTVATKRLEGIDPKGRMFEGDISISTDDGLRPGRYELELTAPKLGRLAACYLTLK